MPIFTKLVLFFPFQISGVSSLHIAAEKSHQDVIELLLKNGAEVGCRKRHDLLCFASGTGETFRFGWGRGWVVPVRPQWWEAVA